MKKILNITIITVVILCLVFVGYQGYLSYEKWQDNKKSDEQKLIETLKNNKGLIIELSTELAEIKKRVVNNILKEIVVVDEASPTYESKKDELIELRKDPEINAEKIEVARIEFEERIDKFQASPDKILINTGEDKIVIYEDAGGNLVSLESGITITRHRELSENVPILVEEKLGVNGTTWDIKAGGYYNLIEKEYGLILSKEILGIKSYSLNVSLLSDLKDLEGINLGANLNYEIRDSLEFGLGVTIDKIYYMCLEYSF